ncbi:MAG: NAD(+)/NADH kinase [Terrimicrobiaceae bacterium]|nr:NAD(+)/NADH kinase [Terrimicrobiaceae bacterium]
MMVGIIAHSSKPEAARAVSAMAAALRRRKVRCLLESDTAALIGQASPHSDRSVARQCGLLVVMGGDGTILRVVSRLGGRLPPVLGINIGSLGFLSGAAASEIPEAAAAVAAGSCAFSERTLLSVEVRSPGRPVRRYRGLNDAVISREERSELVKMEVLVDGEPFTEYNADGLIVATPTGSTAYSLSAGGPILMPDSGAFVVTPICPHVLTNRSTVVSDRSVIEARITRPGQHVSAAVDGQDAGALEAGASIRISRSPLRLRLAHLPGRGFAEILREKLKWSGSNV